MSEAIRWWLVLLLVGTVLLPLCLLAFRRLPDRGYALSKPFGLLLLGFTFWFLNSRNGIDLLPNSRAGILFALLLLAVIAGWMAYVHRDDLLAWLRDNWRYIAIVEGLFLLVFMVAVSLRGLVGQVSGTEQPMDLMFLNATTRADAFPPQDPWLSGYTVAYYYFGYLIVGMVGIVAGVPTEIGYNIGLAMIAALALVGAFGLVYNLVQMREDALNDEAEAEQASGASASAARAATLEATTGVAVGGASTATIAPPERNAKRAGNNAGGNGARSRSAGPGGVPWKAPVFGLAGGLMLIVMGNLVWVFVFASSYGIGGRGFYEWLNVSGLGADYPRDDAWYPTAFFGFFNASRIYPMNDGGPLDPLVSRVITEFPMFSFVLGDLHPHVMALPFVLLALALALTLYRSDEPLDITFWLQRPLLLLASAIILGGLAFLNTWDIATMAFVIVVAAFVANFGRVRALTGDLFVQMISFALPLLLLAVLVYLPFYTSFSSQADGVGAVVTRPGITIPGTRPVHLLLFWGPLFAVVLPFIVARLLAQRDRITGPMLAASASVPAAVIAGWVVLYGFLRATDSPKLAEAGGLATQIADRGIGWVTAIFIGALLAAALLALWLEMTADDERRERRIVLFPMILGATALLLILGTEFYYVGDVFNNRMNTVFKLYYQAWLLLAVAAGFALYYLVSPWRLRFSIERRYRLGWAAAAAIVLAGAALYPIGATYNRTEGNVLGGDRNLRGLQHFPSDEREAIARLNELAQGQKIVIAEAAGNDYTLAGRISAATGIPTILGWAGHEDQWRGSSAPRAGRFEDIERLYTTPSIQEAQEILRKYGVTYVYVGREERARYPEEGLTKFSSLPVMFQSGTVTIYSTRGTGGEVEAAQ